MAADSEGKGFPLKQTDILKQNDLVYEVVYLLVEMKKLLFLLSSLDRIIYWFAYLGEGYFFGGSPQQFFVTFD